MGLMVEQCMRHATCDAPFLFVPPVQKSDKRILGTSHHFTSLRCFGFRFAPACQLGRMIFMSKIFALMDASACPVEKIIIFKGPEFLYFGDRLKFAITKDSKNRKFGASQRTPFWCSSVKHQTSCPLLAATWSPPGKRVFMRLGELSSGSCSVFKFQRLKCGSLLARVEEQKHGDSRFFRHTCIHCM